MTARQMFRLLNEIHKQEEELERKNQERIRRGRMTIEEMKHRILEINDRIRELGRMFYSGEYNGTYDDYHEEIKMLSESTEELERAIIDRLDNEEEAL